MKILTAAEMREADRLTVESGVPSLTLMENAGHAVARFALGRYRACASVAVLCGKGNNGGDGFVAARHMAAAGKDVKVLLLGNPNELRGDAEAMFARLSASGTRAAAATATAEKPGTASPPHASSIQIFAAEDQAALDSEPVARIFAEADLFIDAILGTGFKPPMRGLPVAVREKLQQLKTPVIAVDLPSGWDADSTEQSAPGAFRADAVVTFSAPKLAHVFGHLTAPHVFGPVVVAPIGSPDAAVSSSTGLVLTGSSKATAEVPRDINSNKGKFGHVLVIGGAWGKAGAPSMSSLAALRCGAGLVTAGVPECIVNTLARVTPELMIAPMSETPRVEGKGGTVSAANLADERLNALLAKMTVLALGPGLSTEPEAAAFARGLIEKTTLPIVIDADALNAFAGDAEKLNGRGRTMVLTPHPAEMARLTGLATKEVEADRVGLARRFATEHQVTLVLKGWRTLVAHPDGSIAVNTTGNPAMAKGGSGDILTGIVAAMLAQFPERVADAVNAAVFLHGLAADFAVRDQDEHTVLATDTVAHLWRAFRSRVNDEDGFAWICGLAAAGI